MRHEIDLHGSWVVRCLPRYHVIEGAGIQLFTPQVRQVRTVRRCVADSEAQHFLGWQPEWVVDVMGPDPRRLRVDPRPQPWLGDYMIFGVRRMRSREIIGHVWFNFDDGIVEGSGGFRPDQRRSGLSLAAGFASLALFHRHFGFREMWARTEVDNAGVSKAGAKAGYDAEHIGNVRTLPNGRPVDENTYHSVDEDARSLCRWGHELGRPNAEPG